jgi:hypothetical protein
MNPELLVALGKIAGIGGICIGVLVLIFRTVIHKNFMSQMSQEQSYKITNRIITFTGFIALIGLLAYFISGASASKTNFSVKGIVKDYDNNNVQNILVSIKSGAHDLTKGTTDSEGNFSLTLEGSGKVNVVLEASGQGYISYLKNLEINYDDANLNIGEIKLKSDDPDKSKPIVNAPSQASPNSQATTQEGMVATSGSSNSGFISINTGEYGTLLSSLGASANATLTIGGTNYTLTNTDLTIPFSQPGMVNYQIAGYTYNEMGTVCNNNSVGQIELAAGAKYYLFENLNNTATTDCNWYLFNEYQYMQQKSVLQQRILQAFQ